MIRALSVAYSSPTASFSEAAQKSGRASQKQIALIDGTKLAALMLLFNVGARDSTDQS